MGKKLMDNFWENIKNKPFQMYDESNDEFKKRVIEWYKKYNLEIPEFLIIG